MNILKVFLVAFFTLSLSACGSLGEVPDWLVADKYKLPPAELVEFEAEFEPKEIWSEKTGKGAENRYSKLEPWIQGDQILTIDYQGEVHSYNYAEGRQIWEIELDVPVATGMGGGDGLVLAGTQDGEVLALNETTGEFMWRSRLSSEVLSPPKAGLGVVVARTLYGRITGLSTTDGSVLWKYQRSVPLLSLRGSSAPMLVDDKVIAGYANGKLVALSIYDGKVIWEKSVAVSRGRTEIDRLVDIDSDPVIKYGRIYVVAFHGKLAALELETGRIYWSREMSSRSGLDVDPDVAIYVSDDKSHVWAIQDGSGDALWRQTDLLRRDVTAPVIAGQYIVVGDLEGYVHWLARDDGRFIARTRISKAAIRSKPIVKDGLLFVSATDGKLVAFRVQ